MTRSSLPTLPDLLPSPGNKRSPDPLAKLAAALGPRTGHVVVTAATAQAACALMWGVETEIVAYRTLWLSGRALDAAHLLRTLAADDPLAESLPAAVRTIVAKARNVGRPVVFVVSDADAATAQELEQLRLLSECTPDASELLRLVLLGGPALLETLRRPEGRALATRVTTLVAAPDETVSTALPVTGRLLSAPHQRQTAPLQRRVVAAGVLGSALAAAVGTLLMPAQGPTPASIAAEPAAVVPPAAPATLPPPAAAVTPEPATPPAAAVTPTPATLPPPRAIIHPPSPVTPRLRSVQVGAFRDPARASALRDELARSFEWVMVTDVERNGVVLHRVRIGGLASPAAVDAALAKLRRAGHHPILVRQ